MVSGRTGVVSGRTGVVSGRGWLSRSSMLAVGLLLFRLRGSHPAQLACDPRHDKLHETLYG